MLALNILNIRRFMAAFLAGGLFEEYALIEAQITTYCTFSIDGRREAAFFGEEDGGEAETPPAKPEYVRWGMLRERCFDIIKGKRTPVFFKFVFFYPEEGLDAFLRKRNLQGFRDQLAGLCLNLRFDGTNLVLTTGTSLKTFTMDRSVDDAWDAFVRDLLVQQEILIEDV